MKKNALFAALLITACSEIPPAAYYNRGDPENLLDVSSEAVSLPLASAQALNDLSRMIMQDPPDRAELSCAANDGLCMEARRLFEQYGIPHETTVGSRGVTLMYERVQARDCENRFIDNSINPYNLHHPTFGCSVTGNTVQMVSDRKQFTNPNLMDFQDAEKAVQVYRGYKLPPPPPTDDSGSLLGTITTN